MLKKFSRTTNFILIGIVVGFFVGVSIKQIQGETVVPGTLQADNLLVNGSGSFGNGLVVSNGNMLVPNGKVGIGVLSSTEVLTVTGKVLSSGGFCIGTSCIAQWNDLKTMLGTGGSDSHLTITTTSIPDATVGVPYTFTFASTGGTASIWNLDPYNGRASLGGLEWSNVDDSSRRPNGLGVIRGTPTTAGTYRFTVMVNYSVSKEFTLVVNPSSGAGALTITTPSTFPAAKVGAPYSFTLTSTGGSGRAVWSLPYGPRALPEGLVLDPDTGVISGIPAGTAGGLVFSSNIKLTRGTEYTGIQFSLMVNK